MHRSKFVSTIVLRLYDDAVPPHHYNVLISFFSMVLQDFPLSIWIFVWQNLFPKFFKTLLCSFLNTAKTFRARSWASTVDNVGFCKAWLRLSVWFKLVASNLQPKYMSIFFHVQYIAPWNLAFISVLVSFCKDHSDRSY